MKPIKILYSNPYNEDKLETSFLAKYLPENFTETKEDADLVIEYIHKGLTKEFKKSSKKILISGENLFSKFNLSKATEYFSKKTKINLNFLRRIMPKRILNIKINYFRKNYLNYIKNLAKNPKKGEYAIICNNLKGKNILNIPYFLQIKYITENLSKLKDKKKIKRIPKEFCCIILSNDSSFERIDFTKKLSRYKKVDIYGKTSLTNADNSKLPKAWGDNHKFYSQYKFVICFENSFDEEYITEKLPNAMFGNSIPIYRGAPNVKDYFNTNSFINYGDYDFSYDKMIEKIIELDKDDKKYLEFVNREWLTEENKKFINKKQKELRDFLKRVVEE